MVDIRPQDLNPAVTPIDADSPIIIDQGLAGVNRTTSNEMVNAVAPVATQVEAETGTDDVKRMTALKTKQSIASEVGVSVASYASGQAGLSAVQSVNGKSGNAITLVKADVGLSNVDNTSDANKPISTATQTALNLKADKSVSITGIDGVVGGGDLTQSSTLGLSTASIASLSLADSAVQSVNGKTGASVTLTKSDVGLSNVDNTSDANKPISTATQTALNAKANSSVTITAGAGLTGGGTISANRTLALSSASIASLELADSAVQPAVLNDYATLTQLATKFDNPTGTTAQYIRGDGSLATFPVIPQGTITSVGLVAPTGFTVSNSPVTSSGNLTLSYATGYQGFTTAQSNKLAGVEAGAQVNTVASVNSKTGAVVLSASDVGAATAAQGAKADTAVQPAGLTKAAVGLGNVDNTSDAAKPVSTAQQAALNLKADTATQIIAGAGLTGGGDLSANRTVNVGAGTGISVAADAVSLNAASIASLAKADSAIQAPGGTAGQVLAKNSAADNDVAWISSEAATAVSYGPQTLTAPQKTQARSNIDALGLLEKAADSSKLDGKTIAQLWATMGGAVTLGSAGYEVSPSGLIRQYGVTSQEGAAFTVAFPMAFPTACVGVQLQLRHDTLPAGDAIMLAVISPNQTDFSIAKRLVNSASVAPSPAGYEIYYEAIGY